MDFISIHTLQSLGLAIMHSLWQIGLIIFLYFYFILIRKRLSVNVKYTLGLISFAIILISFIFTFHIIRDINSYSLPVNSGNSVLNISNGNILLDVAENEAVEAHDNARLHDFNYYKIRRVVNQIAGTIGAVWILGLIFFLFQKILAYYKLKSIKNNKYNIRSKKWDRILNEISSKLNLRRNVNFLFSPYVNSPLSFGFLKPVILFPLRITTGLSSEEIKCILIHELAHNLRNDYLCNLFQIVIEALFFYHPGIWWMSGKIRTQREILCDKIVLDNKISEKFYANTLLKLGELQITDFNMAVAAKRSDSELLTRIRHIVNKQDSSSKRKGHPLFVVGVVIILMVSGFVFDTKENLFKVPINNSKIEESLSALDGAFVFYDFNQDKYFTSNDSLCNVRYPAYSTFKIASSLIALDLGIAKDGSYSIKYDSIKYPLPDWMKNDNFFKHWFDDHTIKTALKYSVNWFYTELGEQIGTDNIVDYMKRLNYGNQAVSTGEKQAWYIGKLKISPNEQVDFIKNILNKNCTGISKDAQRIIKQIFPCEVEDGYTLYGKTGTGDISEDRMVGWYIGYLETNDNTYAYALEVFANDMNAISMDKRQEMVKDIFVNLGLIVK